MPLDELHREVAAIALRAAAEHGFALGGGNALIAHGIISRPTQDVDLFTDREAGVTAAAGTVEAALRREGFEAERQDNAAGIVDLFPGMDEGLAEWIVTKPGGRQMTLQMGYFDRSRSPVIMEVGPVLDLEDVVGGKVCALASRGYERDYVDTAAAVERYTPDQLISFAKRLDPGLTDQDFADAGRRLDRLGDRVFTRYGLGVEDVTRLRERFAAWPRVAEASGGEEPADHAATSARQAERTSGPGEQISAAWHQETSADLEGRGTKLQARTAHPRASSAHYPPPGPGRGPRQAGQEEPAAPHTGERDVNHEEPAPAGEATTEQQAAAQPRAAGAERASPENMSRTADVDEPEPEAEAEA